MQLRHISPRSTDWMDAMEEGAGGRGWEKLAPEEQIKLLRERRDEEGGGREGGGRGSGSGRSGLVDDVALEVGDQDLGRAVLRVASLGGARHVVHQDREHDRQVAG